MLAEVAGEIADAHRAVRRPVVLKRPLRMPRKDRFLVLACPSQMLDEDLLGRIIWAVVQGHEEV
jgi:hypothetical protein